MFKKLFLTLLLVTCLVQPISAKQFSVDDSEGLFKDRPVVILLAAPKYFSAQQLQSIYRAVKYRFNMLDYKVQPVEQLSSTTFRYIHDTESLRELADKQNAQVLVLIDIYTLNEYITEYFPYRDSMLVVQVSMQVYVYDKADNRLSTTKTRYSNVDYYPVAEKAMDIVDRTLIDALDKFHKVSD